MAATEKYNFRTKIYKCCGKDDLRPALHCVYFGSEFAFASDGYVSLKQPLSFHDIVGRDLLEGRMLHAKTYEAIMSFEMAECLYEGIECKNTNGQTVLFEYHKLPDDVEPIDMKLFFNRIERELIKTKSLSEIGVHADHLSRLDTAMYSPGGLRLRFVDDNAHIIVDDPSVDGQIGVMIPRYLEPALFKV